MGEAEAIRVLLEFSDKLTPSNVFYFLARFLGWGLIKLLEILVNSAQGVLDEIMEFLNFFDSSVVNEIIDKIKPVAIAFLVISLLYIAYHLMVNRKKFDISKIPGNIIIALLIIFFLPTAMKSLGDVTKEGFKLFTTTESTLATQIISNNVTDIYLYDQDNFENRNIEPRNKIDKNNITKIDPTEEIDRSNVRNKKVFENKLIPNSSGEGYELKRINGWFKIDSEYYRWDINFFQIITTLLITALVLIFTMIKVVKLMMELAFSKIFIIGGALADIGSGQKTKQMLMHILSLYIAIVSVGLTLELYILGTAWLQNNLTGFAGIMINFGAGLFVIDGPNLLEKIFGVDAGLSSGVRTLMGINSAMDILGKIGRGLDKVGDVAKAGLGAGAVLGAGLKGFRDGAIPDLEDEMNNEGFNPLQQSLLDDGEMKKIGDSNSDIDNGLFNSIDDTPPNNMPPNNGEENDISDLYNSNKENADKLNNDLDDNISDLDNRDIQGFDDLDKDIPTLDEYGVSDISSDNMGNSLSDGLLQGDNFITGNTEPLRGKGNGLTNYDRLAKGENKEWSYGNTSNPNFNSNMNNDYGVDIDWGVRRRGYDKPNYIDPKETRNVKDFLGGLINSKVNNIKNGELANNMRTSYKIGNNTAKDLRRYVGIKEQEIKDKIVADRIRRNL
ncbi:hypothetical protein NSA50_18090 [Clostridium sp. DSM 100503]|uniref:pLS20_p028 family conjugation system transmembrane protein n=1 Tax=Clostridium sp. DSM 100503 TaxID=2963282 RepID=UPI00214A67A4|nr:hypothetical protein [Clostridium sp. DSM 100503]MCR1952916.1 hypothetical protein [Clostridium sp. DSM 100503]